MGFGGFILGLLLLGGIVGLVWLFMIGAFNDLLNFPATAAQPTAIIGTATPTETPQPTEAPTSVPQVVVPNLAGLNEQQALDAVEQARLLPQEAAPRYSDTIAEGLVIDQFPLAGMSITETSIVTFAISLGQDLVDMPNVQRLRLADAQRALEGFGFIVRVQEEQSATVGNGFIIRQSPLPGDRLPRGETVTIVVSIGNDVTVPELAGLTEDEAKQQLAQVGLVWSFTDYQDCEKLGEVCDRFGPGVVVSSDPRVGEVVPRGTGVTLGVRAP
jgi:serine/threonine-protein kinase